MFTLNKDIEEHIMTVRHQNEESRRMERLKPHQMKHNENTVGIVTFEIRYIRSLM